MVKTKNSDTLKKLIKMKKRAVEANQFKVVAKLNIRINNIYSKTKNKSLLEWD